MKKFTHKDGTNVYINPNYIVTIGAYEEDGKMQWCIEVVTGAEYSVKESIEEIDEILFGELRRSKSNFCE